MTTDQLIYLIFSFVHTTPSDAAAFRAELQPAIIKWVEQNLDPEHVFDHDDLCHWCMDNGYAPKRHPDQ